MGYKKSHAQGKKLRKGGDEMKNYARQIERIKNTVQIEHSKLLTLQDELDDKIKDLSPGENVGVVGVMCVQLLDAINSAEDAISIAYYYLRQAKKIVGDN